MSAPLLPEAPFFVLANARVHASMSPGLRAGTDRDGFALADIHVAGGKVARVSASEGRRAEAADTVDLRGRIVLPCFVDCHTHIDKGHIWPRKPNPDGTFQSALEAAGKDRLARWTATDVGRRMDFSLRCAHADACANPAAAIVVSPKRESRMRCVTCDRSTAPRSIQ